MTHGDDGKIVLAIESAIEGGSLSLLLGASEIASRIGTAGVSRAEDLIADIHELLKANGISPRDLAIVAASAGPGSFTGVRIGIATALGLARGSRARFASVSLLHACASAYLQEGQCTVALPVGRGAIAIQAFVFDPLGVRALWPPELVPLERLDDVIGGRGKGAVLLHNSLLEAVNQNDPVEALGRNLAYSVATACAGNHIVTDPIFLSKK